MSEVIGTADRAKFHDARRAFADGATVLVSERDDGPTKTVTSLTTTHNRETTTWDTLAENVKVWRNRYPGQRFYIVRKSNYDRVIERATDKGREDGNAVASWYFDGNTPTDTFRRVLAGIADGDPAILNTFPQPDLSGQHAGTTTGTQLYAEACHEIVDPDDQFDSLFGEVCDAYEDAFRTEVECEITRVAEYHTS